ncbi:phosphonate metabolism protein/1,5-bisphosphokinase (PRPP-forming) PhnN [Enterovibrio coralii]|uniref:Ribose 1,5-bisphosphate phosphokinase PhnN n=1 Tax=Enterovibrio coralii TaxID=294935 RepID=A0A135ICC5_9GAMM|nr:phosphonate metabolism protein/1,5-bisphosphokinase (PRPP-forming) PhnN [Enterovibrio coralii]KXF83075.1 ribose 1,5-bisphosphate phosphokinase PhnN [Enterovibrio coralii]
MGKLFYVVGASGAGKDTVIDSARELFGDHLVIAHRYITRSVLTGRENHVALTEVEFEQRIKHRMFSMHWQAHGLRYGIGKEIENWLASGVNVMVNGSRAYLPYAKEVFGRRLQVVWVAVRPDILQQRLEARERENNEDITERLERAIRYDAVRPTSAILIDNSGSEQDTARQVQEKLEQIIRLPFAEKV